MLKSQIESILFLSNNVVNLEKLQKFFKVDVNDLKNILNELKDEYSEEKNKGIILLVNEHSNELKNEYQFVVNMENKEIVQKYFRLNDNIELSKTALETLTIIAYRAPISKVELEYIRGVNSTQILKQLKAKELIIEIDNDQYEVSNKFLQILGIQKLSDLDNYDDLHNLDLLMNNNNEEEIKNNEENLC